MSYEAFVTIVILTGVFAFGLFVAVLLCMAGRKARLTGVFALLLIVALFFGIPAWTAPLNVYKCTSNRLFQEEHQLKTDNRGCYVEIDEKEGTTYIYFDRYSNGQVREWSLDNYHVTLLCFESLEKMNEWPKISIYRANIKKVYSYLWWSVEGEVERNTICANIYVPYGTIGYR